MNAASFEEFLSRLDVGLAAGFTGDRRSDVEAGSAAPDWLAQVVSALFDGQSSDAAAEWARRVHGELVRVGWEVPITVVYQWYAHCVSPLLVAAMSQPNTMDWPSVMDRSSAIDQPSAIDRQRAVQARYAEAAAGERVDEAEWAAVLEPALRDVYRQAYAYADGYAVAHANALAYASANGFSEVEALEFGVAYADLNTGASVTSFADANAIANSQAFASAFATGDADAFARAYPCAIVQAYARACANVGGVATESQRRHDAYRQLASGFVDSLTRVRNASGGPTS